MSAEQLPVRIYTTADGLPRDLILRIVRDSHGFLWFCTGDGLSRFNGYEFTTYGVEHGLPHPVINDLLETRSGVYWVATNGGGVARFNPSPARNQQPQKVNLFTVIPVGDELSSNRVNVLYEDRVGHVWAGTDGGLFGLDETGGQTTFRRISLNLRELEQQVAVRALIEDREGSLWISTQGLGLLRLLPDGRTIRPSCLRADIASLQIRTTAGVVFGSNSSCFPYLCDTDTKTCATGCAGTGSCASGMLCVDGKCVYPRTFCKDHYTSANIAGETRPCSPYSCDPWSGLCRTVCENQSDCGDRFNCSSEGRCLP